MSEKYMINQEGDVPKEPFTWRGKGGKLSSVTTMDTTHMFNTLVMIWNHAVPESFKLKPYIHYTFDPDFYTPTYMSTALTTLLVEIKKRRDLTDEQCVKLEKISAMARELMCLKFFPLV